MSIQIGSTIHVRPHLPVTYHKTDAGLVHHLARCSMLLLNVHNKSTSLLNGAIIVAQKVRRQLC